MEESDVGMDLGRAIPREQGAANRTQQVRGLLPLR